MRQRSGGSRFEASPGQIVHETLSQKYPSKKGLVEWLRVQALSSSPTSAKKKKKSKHLEWCWDIVSAR
jgi:hypothetical protein